MLMLLPDNPAKALNVINKTWKKKSILKTVEGETKNEGNVRRTDMFSHILWFYLFIYRSLFSIWQVGYLILTDKANSRQYHQVAWSLCETGL